MVNGFVPILFDTIANRPTGHCVCVGQRSQRRHSKVERAKKRYGYFLSHLGHTTLIVRTWGSQSNARKIPIKNLLSESSRASMEKRFTKILLFLFLANVVLNLEGLTRQSVEFLVRRLCQYEWPLFLK